ncbi:MAG: 3-hydroxybutyryl-CoA dehydratase / 3-hydroxyacyl-CoA dehydrogenase, partial [Phenylobacterium sp.]|nr:3-hydroxybutyryl-CoA dehydratase / 3-hydroxyacyl-CoA dehydrogenase [Phenylobacterium sp.]
MALVLSDTVDGVRIITLNRPERHNAINDEMGEVLGEAWDEALADDSARAILIKANGRSFCSGRDVAVLGHRARQESDFHFVRRAQVGRMRNQLDSPK